MPKEALILVIMLLLTNPTRLVAADNLKLNPHLDFMKNGVEGKLITGDHMDDGVVRGLPNYIVFYADFCFNAKRQALRTVELYRLYKDRVHFVVVDWSGLTSSDQLPPSQRPLSLKYFRGDFPHTTILDKTGKVVFDYTGEAPAATLIGWLDAALTSPQASPELSAENKKP